MKPKAWESLRDVKRRLVHLVPNKGLDPLYYHDWWVDFEWEVPVGNIFRQTDVAYYCFSNQEAKGESYLRNKAYLEKYYTKAI